MCACTHPRPPVTMSTIAVDAGLFPLGVPAFVQDEDPGPGRYRIGIEVVPSHDAHNAARYANPCLAAFVLEHNRPRIGFAAIFVASPADTSEAAAKLQSFIQEYARCNWPERREAANHYAYNVLDLQDYTEGTELREPEDNDDDSE